MFVLGKTNQQSDLFIYEAEAWEELRKSLGISLAFRKKPNILVYKGMVVKLHAIFGKG